MIGGASECASVSGDTKAAKFPGRNIPKAITRTKRISVPSESLRMRSFINQVCPQRPITARAHATDAAESIVEMVEYAAGYGPPLTVENPSCLRLRGQAVTDRRPVR